ncbi:MAG: glycosyltransferase family protein, partial [Dehalococcoidales bacterium]|nr:glycosyltransferase family protein [Dehalococcoidales bacterium]
MKVIPIVQVRMGSTRLPGKALKEIAGKPMLWHIVNRLKHARLVSEVVIATSNKEGNEPIVKFAADNGIECYAGSEDDILDRFYQAVKKHNPDAVIRVTGDCPLVDPAIIDGMIRYYLNPKNGKPRFDVICNYMPPTYPDGLDVDLISFKVWEKAWRKLKSPWREWVPTYFFEHPERYRLGNMAYKEDLSHMRWTVDYPEDLDFVTRIYEKLYQEGEVFLMADILKLLAEHPELNEINKNYTIAAPSRRELRER